MNKNRRDLSITWQLLMFFLISLNPSLSMAAAPAGYSEYFVPGDEEDLLIFHNSVLPDTWTQTHSVITVTAWSPDTVIYYDHWENGYYFDPQDPEKTDPGYPGPGNHSYDETVTLAARGASHTFESATIPAAPRNPANTFYDGRDRIFAIGGAISVNRVTWPSAGGTVEAIGMEVYPLRPQLTTYIMPLGEDLSAGTISNPDFERVSALIQATADGTVVQFDLNGDGALGDSICTSRNWPCTASDTQITLNAGECFLLDRYSSSPTTGDPAVAGPQLLTGTIIQGNQTLQVHYLFCNRGSNYDSRGVSAFPTGFWDDQYYAPVGTDTGANNPTDIFLHNPNSSAITINYESTAGTGSFNINPNTTASYYTETTTYVTQNSATYLKGSDVFWGISSIDNGGQVMDWSYSLIPASFLTDEYFIGWAPGAVPVSLTYADDSGLFISAVQDNVRVFVDKDSDGAPDETFDLAHLQSRYVYDATDGDMSRSNIWATGPITIAYGQNPDTAIAGNPAVDTGDAMIPGIDFVDLVLSVDKTTDPVIVSTMPGSTADYTLVVRSAKYTLDAVSVVDTLPAGWEYVTGTTTITRADQTTRTDDPDILGQTLTWDSGVLGNMMENQEITITFTARTSGSVAFTIGDMTRNYVEAIGTRTVGDPAVTQRFTTSDFAFNTFSDTPSQMTVQKTSSGVDPLSPGDSFTYTVTVTNNGTSTINGVAVYDPMPAGVSYAGPLAVSHSTVGDRFTTAAYNNNDGTNNWGGNWIETAETTDATADDIRIVNGELRLNNDASNEPTIYRNVNMGSPTSAVLTFNYRTTGVEASDTVRVQYRVGTTYTDVGTFNGSVSGIFSSVIPTTTNRIRFVFNNNDYTDANDLFYVDDLYITYNVARTDSAYSPPNLINSSNGYSLAAGQSLTVTVPVQVDDPLATGIDSITNSACVTATGFMVPVCDDVTNIVSNPGSGTAEVGDLVWFDIDGDGIKDVGENGFANIEVTLRDEYGTPVATTTTDGNGRFRFTGIEPGTGYYLEVMNGLPPELIQSAPADHTDDRTNAFNLSAGQVYLDADLGYTADAETGTIGDYVWHDVDGDRAQDGGEPGLAGVTVELYQDDGDGVFEPGAGDVLVTSTTTDAGGFYLLTGVTASGTQDYFVYVNSTQTSLSGYSPTTVTATQVVDLAAGNVRMTNDFGFRNTNTYSYRDRVWFDQNEDQADDGETGIGGVTVDLLDASLNVIATTTTAADGTFEFGGLSGSTFYRARITDNNSKLTDYFGITAEAVAGEFKIVGLTGNVDYTTGSLEPNFGYSVDGAIGDTVFNDANNNGDKDSEEFGISGVTVNLYRDNGDNVRNAGDTLTATLITDASGKFLFSGLDDGTYFVDIDPTQAVLNSYNNLTTADDETAAGHQREYTITGGSSDLTIDFGYRSADNRSVSGTIWKDDDQDGVIDAGETRLENVTVDLLDSTGATIISTATTDTSGNYSFTGLPSDTYTVRVTDENGVVNGYITTYEFNDAAVEPPYNGEATVDLGSGDQSGINFGYKDPVVTRAVIGEFGAFNEGGKVVVRWQTLSEEGTIGFYLYRLNEKTGLYKMINNKLLPGLLHSPAGGWYSYQDKTAKIGGYYTYRLEEVEVGGNRISYGPWKVYTGTLLSGEKAAVALKANAFVAGFKQAAQPLSDKTKKRIEARLEARLDALALRQARRGIQAKISVSEEGMYFVNAENIAQVLNKSQGEVVRLMLANKIRLRNKGRFVAVLPASDNSGLYFYGEKLETAYTDENVYWLDVQNSLMMGKVDRTPKLPAGDPQYFRQWVREEENHYPLANMFTDPKEDFWMWDYVFPGYGRDQVSISVSTPGVVDAGKAALTVAFQGGSEAFVGDDHHAVVSINGVVVGDVRWDGIAACKLSVPVGTEILNNGENSVEISGIKESGVPYNIFYINYLTIEYPRHYTAVDNHLTAESNDYDGDTVTIDGFTDPDIRVFDIVNPLRPKVLSGVKIETAGTNAAEYQVSIRKGVQVSRYLAVTPDAIKSCTLIADKSSSLKNKSNRADYLIITSTDMVAAAQKLAAYRASRGHVSQVKDIEDIYDEFFYGIKDPEAIRMFLAYAVSQWRTPPKYVLLAGDGSFDYKDYKGFGDSVIPPFIAGTPDGLRVTDYPYSDVAGTDRIPELAIGRIPVFCAEELMAYINKIMGFEASDGDWTRKAILAADAPDSGGDFTVSSEEVAGFFPVDYILDRLYLDVTPISKARSNLVNSINEGRAYVNFIGHGAMFQIGNHNLFSTNDLSKLHNGMQLPVVTAMTCVAGDFGYPGFDSLNEDLVLKSDGGAVAMWAPSGYTYNQDSVDLCKGFYNALFIGGEKVLGDAIRWSQENYANRGEDMYHLDLYNLVGDPALELK